MKVHSPVTHSDNVKFVKKIEVQHVIKLYESLGIQVKEYFTGLAYVEIYKCHDTGLEFFYPTTLAGDARFYEQLDKIATNYYSPWKWEHDIAIEYSQHASRILEIGCAYGTFLNENKRRGVKEVCGLELNTNAVNAAQKDGLDVRNELIEEHSKTNVDAYDFVGSFQVVEHISDLKSFFEHSIKCLKPGGHYVISVPNNDCYFFKHDIDHILNLPPHHMGLWTEESLRALAPLLGLQVVEIFKEPAKVNNYGMYYEVFLRKKLGLRGSILKFVYQYTRPFVKLLMRISPPKYGACITAVYKKKAN